MLLLSLCQIVIFVFNSLQQINDISLVSMLREGYKIQNIDFFFIIYILFSTAQYLTVPI